VFIKKLKYDVKYDKKTGEEKKKCKCKVADETGTASIKLGNFEHELLKEGNTINLLYMTAKIKKNKIILLLDD
jgi:hypothetical protein